MGNICTCCASAKRQKNDALISKSRSKKNKQTERVLPADLHASSGQTYDAGSTTTNVALNRPGTLEIQSDLRDGPSSKFPPFSLHGIQKSSPVTASGEQTPILSDEIRAKSIEKLFETYRDTTTDEELILADGVERFCQDLDVDPADFIVLALAWEFKAQTMCKFTKKEFVDGFVRLQCDSIESLRSAFKRIELDALNNFKDLYRYTFQFSLDLEQGQRSLPCDIAIAMWGVVFSRNSPAILQSWFDFLQDKKIRGISRDTWNMFLYLTESLNDDLSNYNDSEAWPSLFDDFVDYKREELENNKNKLEDDASSEEETQTHKVEDTESSIESIEGGNTVSKLDLPGAILTSEESVGGADSGDPNVPLQNKTFDSDTEIHDPDHPGDADHPGDEASAM